MGNKYSAMCSKYPYKGYTEYCIKSNYVLPFILKVIWASRKYEIIDIRYRSC